MNQSSWFFYRLDYFEEKFISDTFAVLSSITKKRMSIYNQRAFRKYSLRDCLKQKGVIIYQ